MTMQRSTAPSPASGTSRRTFLRNSSLLVAGGAIAASQVQIARGAHAFGSDTIKVGLVGCGGRGTGAAIQAMNTSGGEVKLVAMADAFRRSAAAGAYRGINGQHNDEGRCAQGPAVRRLQRLQGAAADRLRHGDSGHAARLPPAALRSRGRRPASTSLPRSRSPSMRPACASSWPRTKRPRRRAWPWRSACSGGTSGSTWTRSRRFRTARSATSSWPAPIGTAASPGSRRGRTARPKWSTRCATGTTSTGSAATTSSSSTSTTSTSSTGSRTTIPTTAQGQGGCVLREKDFGEIFDHHMVEFTYGDGTVMLSQCRHQPDTWQAVSEHVHGTKGYCRRQRLEDLRRTTAR